MQFTHSGNIRITAYLLLTLAVTQAVYTALYVAGVSIPKQFFWGLESLLFTVLAAFSGAALIQSKSEQVGWAAIAFSAPLNVVQVCIGLTMFGAFRQIAGQSEALQPLAGAVVALSFMIYYAAKVLLGLAALNFGMAQMNKGAKTLGGLTALVGAIAILANAVLLTFGRDSFLPSPVAGGSGVVATLLLAICLIRTSRES